MSLSIKDLYLIKNDYNKIKQYTLVKFITCTNSGQCYLVADISDDKNREWIMYYDLYPIDKEKFNYYRYNYSYNKEIQEIADQKLKEFFPKI